MLWATHDFGHMWKKFTLMAASNALSPDMLTVNIQRKY